MDPDLKTMPLRDEEINASPTHSFKSSSILKDCVMLRSLLPFIIMDKMTRSNRAINMVGETLAIR